MVRANPGPAAAVEAPPGASAAILDALPPPPPNGASDLPYRDTRADPRRQIASTGGREARTRAAALYPAASTYGKDEQGFLRTRDRGKAKKQEAADVRSDRKRSTPNLLPR
eukprot:scaffold16766_cov43-Phaeocystis_antarctica.AAC.2